MCWAVSVQRCRPWVCSVCCEVSRGRWATHVADFINTCVGIKRPADCRHAWFVKGSSQRWPHCPDSAGQTDVLFPSCWWKSCRVQYVSAFRQQHCWSQVFVSYVPSVFCKWCYVSYLVTELHICIQTLNAVFWLIFVCRFMSQFFQACRLYSEPRISGTFKRTLSPQNQYGPSGPFSVLARWCSLMWVFMLAQNGCKNGPTCVTEGGAGSCRCVSDWTSTVGVRQQPVVTWKVSVK